MWYGIVYMCVCVSVCDLYIFEYKINKGTSFIKKAYEFFCFFNTSSKLIKSFFRRRLNYDLQLPVQLRNFWKISQNLILP